MKVTYRKDGKPYMPPGHYDVKCVRLHDKDTSDADHLILGMSYFLPNGGGADYAVTPDGANIIYYIAYGEMTVTTDNGEYVLHEGDSICFNPGDGRSCKNTGTEPALMIVIMGK